MGKGHIRNLSGQRYGRWTVIDIAGFGKWHEALWNCVCDCGQEKIVRGALVSSGRSKSCGCLQKDYLRTVKPAIIYKDRDRILHSKWKSMIQRCTKDYFTRYENWGGRGISVCDEWKDYDKFAEWAWNNGYKQGLTLDRIDNDGNYEPQNCKWSTIIEQANNRRTSAWLEIGGRTQTVAQWAKSSGVSSGTIFARKKAGYSGNDLLLPISHKTGKPLVYHRKENPGVEIEITRYDDYEQWKAKGEK